MHGPPHQLLPQIRTRYKYYVHMLKKNSLASLAAYKCSEVGHWQVASGEILRPQGQHHSPGTFYFVCRIVIGDPLCVLLQGFTDWLYRSFNTKGWLIRVLELKQFIFSGQSHSSFPSMKLSIPCLAKKVYARSSPPMTSCANDMMTLHRLPFQSK